eukprot:1340408-Pyramimonas_sp.AAC.1
MATIGRDAHADRHQDRAVRRGGAGPQCLRAIWNQPNTCPPPEHRPRGLPCRGRSDLDSPPPHGKPGHFNLRRGGSARGRSKGAQRRRAGAHARMGLGRGAAN